MASTPDRIRVSGTNDYLDTTVVQQDTGPAHREGVFIGDPETVGNRQKVTSDGISYNGLMGAASAGNTSTTALAAGATYTGTGEQNDYPAVMVSCQTDGHGTLYFDFSVNGTDWSTFPTSGFDVASGIHEFHTAVKGPRYFRVRLVNDATAQSYLRLYTYYGSFGRGNAPLNQTVSLDADATVVRPTSIQDEIRIGRRTGIDGWTKFGYSPSLTATAGEQTIWADTGGNFTPMSAPKFFTVLYDTGVDGAGPDGDSGAQSLAVYYVDTGGDPAVATHTLGSDGSDTTSFMGYGINRVAVTSSGAQKKNGGKIELLDTGDSTLQAIIPTGGSVTQQAIYVTGDNHDAVAKFLWINVAKPGGGDAKVTVKGYVYNRTVDTTYEVFRAIVDTASETTMVIDEPIGFNLSPTDVLYFVADTNTNAAVVNLRFSLNLYQRI